MVVVLVVNIRSPNDNKGSSGRGGDVVFVRLLCDDDDSDS